MSLTVTAVPPGASSLTLRSANLTLTVLPPIPRSSTCYEDFGSTPTASASHGAERMRAYPESTGA
jgi:hypothetical protein